jgi:glucuronate isomerase
MDENFLLGSESARRLYFEGAAGKPIIDFHCHLPPREIAEDQRHDGIARLWLGGDHYKWRVMRANGIPEELVTGKAPWEEKFAAWARTMPRLVGNPLYHWTHLELRRYFGVEEQLSESNAEAVRRACDSVLARPEYSTRGLLRMMNVRAVCTTDDPADDLAWHKAYASSRREGDPVMVPTFRPDKAMACEDPAAWNAYIARLEAASGVRVLGWDGLARALTKRHEAFHAAGCRASDHALELPVHEAAREEELERIVMALRKGEAPDARGAAKLKTEVLLLVGRLDAERGWAMQLHLAAIRNLNSRMFAALGPDTGYDAIGDGAASRALAAFLDALEREGKLPKTVLYTLNPSWNEALVSIGGCFQDGSTPGKIQFGSAWWFNDQADGMTRQLTALASMGMLSRFVGMLTDSRSFLSFPRHEYFRRLVCDIVGDWVERGEAPADFKLLGGIVEDIAWRNAASYFGIPGVGA